MKRLIAYLAVISVLITLAGCRTELINAIVINDLAAVQTKISTGADVNEKSPDNFSPLHWAADYGRLEIARLLIEKGADLNLRSENYGTPLMAAAYRGHKDIVKLLLEKGANTTATDAYGKTALNYAEEYQFVEIARILNESSPPPPIVKVTPVGEKAPAGGPFQAKVAPGGTIYGNFRQISMAVFTFESNNVEASPYALEIVNSLSTRLETIPAVQLLGRRDLENFLSVNDLQQSNNLDNILQIGSRLDLGYIVSGRVEKKDAMIIVNCQLVSIGEKKAILSRVIRVFGNVNLQQEVVKFGESVAEVLSRVP